MKKMILVALCTVFAVIGCKKDQPQTATADDAANGAGYESDGKGGEGASVESSNVQTATGEMRELLLVLHRVHFPLDTSTLTEAARDALEEASVQLKKMTDITLAVEGHTDERGTNEYNMSLAERRAQTVVSYLENLGVDPARLQIASFGEEKPMEAGSGELANAKNRRVDFRLKQGDVEFVLEEGELVDDEGNPL
ncbi:MAG: OmpA family protein [Deltaproteobacteria bacterium]|nr:OmpA family protein [Deltaproteobacteria bacterium]MBN2673004.1 OmpA family protein [Deltaproteobacteria bacterium]